jgi:hypothetical protein
MCCLYHGHVVSTIAYGSGAWLKCDKKPQHEEPSRLHTQAAVRLEQQNNGSFLRRRAAAADLSEKEKRLR